MINGLAVAFDAIKRERGKALKIKQYQLEKLIMPIPISVILGNFLESNHSNTALIKNKLRKQFLHYS